MTHQEPKPEVVNYIKHLENQNQKFRKLLILTLDVTNQNFANVCMQQEESTILENTVDNKKTENNEMETLLTTVMSTDESNINKAIEKLEKEHLEFKTKFDESVNNIKQDDEEIDLPGSCDLQIIIAQIGIIRKSLEERINFIEKKESILSVIKSKLKAHLIEIQQKEESVIQMNSNTFNILEIYDDTLNSLDNTRMTREISLMNKEIEMLTALTEKTFEKNKNMTVCPNTTFFNKTVVVELDSAKNKLYKDLEETIENYSKEINEIRLNLPDPEIKMLIHEIDIQKTELYYNIKLAKLQDEPVLSSSSVLEENKVPDSVISKCGNTLKVKEKNETKQSTN